MPVNRCNECGISKMIRIKEAVEKRLINRMPEEVREPLQEAKRNLRLAIQGFVNHLTDETDETIPRPSKKVPVE